MEEKKANGVGPREGVPRSMRKQLAVAVRSIQWSYAIFWSPSPTQQGILEWGDGYYNGDIKTRKTVQAGELTPDKILLQRSEQLRQLYEALQEGESEQQQSKRPSASLSPEDLTDEEWYYLVCMSFVFNPSEGLPGRALANDRTIWLCNAQYADSKVFPRSLLAKSASIQTVVCFPYLGGVIELGVTEMVEEDPRLLQHIKVALLNLSKPLCSSKSSFAPQNGDYELDAVTVKVDDEILDDLVFENLLSSTERINFHQERHTELPGNLQMEFTEDSPDECSNGCEHNQETENSFMVEAVNGGGASQVQSWHFFEDDFSNGFQCSMNSSDCISEAVVHPVSRNPNTSQSLQLKELQECNHSKLSSLDLGPEDDVTHYKRTVSIIIRNSHPSNDMQKIGRCCGCKSSFICWKISDGIRVQPEHQKLLKNMLFKVPLMYENSHLQKPKEQHAEGCVLLAKKKENDKFLLLKSMVPAIDEIDKASILNDTILYLKELEARVEELESCMDSTDFSKPVRRKSSELGEQSSDNYENRKLNEGRRQSIINKRKACDIDETENEEFNPAPQSGGQPQLKVHIKDKEVLIEMRCPYREYLLLDIMEAINNLHLDAHSIQSSSSNGVLTLTLKSMFRGAAISPAGMIKQALQKIMGSC
ncbi:hypothetical protein SAY87_030328 [Trapa incisa]|uniref:BHLH domain-containing protein n=1 Tax=Trapa incisa TaxID=236973 RepID=A0AAN7KM82_9MYRT|nr:hypothetical protein SAY87_030328 [Trapa incisa]